MKTKIVNCGNCDENPEGISDTTLWCVVCYNSGSYEGDGIAYKQENDGKIYVADLGHCSCYGPWDDGWQEIDSSELQMQLTGKPGSQEKTIEKAILSVCPHKLRRELGFEEYNENADINLPDLFY